MATLDQRPSGAWRVRWRLAGQPQSVSFDNEDEAVRARQLVEAYRHSKDKNYIYCEVMGIPLPGTAAAAALGPVVRDLVEGYTASLLDADVRTRRDNQKRLELSVLPVVGDLPIGAVTTDHINQIINELSQTRKKPTVDRYFNVMKGFFSYAVKKGTCVSNPVKEVEYKPLGLGKYHIGVKEDHHFYMPKPQYLLLRSKFCSADQLLLDFLAYTGARWGEAAAIKVGAVKKKGTHTVVDIVDTWKEADPGEYVIGTPKSGSKRTIPVPSWLAADLMPLMKGKRKDDSLFSLPAGRTAYYEMRYRWETAVRSAARCELHPPEAEGRRVEASELESVNCGENGGRNHAGKPCGRPVARGWNRCRAHQGIPVDVDSTCECWDQAKPRRLERRPKIHDLRHTHASWLVLDGIPIKAISVRLGHSSIEVTEKVYAGLLREIDDRIVAVLSDRDENELAA